jgi:hypothetical protein
MAWELDQRDVPTQKRRFCVEMVCDEIMDAIGIPLALPVCIANTMPSRHYSIDLKAEVDRALWQSNHFAKTERRFCPNFDACP